jgi:hypothetical protein
MFKFIFRTIGTLTVLVVLIIVLAVWKGGEPFRTLGMGTVIMGQYIQKFADLVDDMKRGGSEIQKTYDKFKDVMETDKENGRE